jgi:hypothetical protein
LIFAATAGALFWLSKRIAIHAQSTGAIGAAFKRHVIENVYGDLSEALKAVEIFNNRILSAQVVREFRHIDILTETGASRFNRRFTRSLPEVRHDKSGGRGLL